MPLPVRLFNARLKRLQASLDVSDQATAMKMRDQLKAQVEALPENSVVVKDNASTLYKVQNDLFWEGLF